MLAGAYERRERTPMRLPAAMEVETDGGEGERVAGTRGGKPRGHRADHERGRRTGMTSS
jgi:hypothetical protein